MFDGESFDHGGIFLFDDCLTDLVVDQQGFVESNSTDVAGFVADWTTLALIDSDGFGGGRGLTRRWRVYVSLSSLGVAVKRMDLPILTARISLCLTSA